MRQLCFAIQRIILVLVHLDGFVVGGTWAAGDPVHNPKSMAMIGVFGLLGAIASIVGMLFTLIGNIAAPGASPPASPPKAAPPSPVRRGPHG